MHKFNPNIATDFVFFCNGRLNALTVNRRNRIIGEPYISVQTFPAVSLELYSVLYSTFWTGLGAS